MSIVVGFWVIGAPLGVSPLDCDDGHMCGSTVPVPAQLERFGRVGQWRVPGRRLVGLLTAYAVRIAEPLRLVDFGYVQTVLPELDSGFRATGAIWSRRAVAGPGPEFGSGLTGLQVAYGALRCAGCRAFSAWLIESVFGPSSRDASSKATPVYHLRG
jgi:hypothetical protein